MESVEILFIHQILLSLKEGKSVHYAEQKFKEQFPIEYNKISLIDKKSHSSILYELDLLLIRGRSGYPILKSLLDLRKRAFEKYLMELDRFVQKAPFLSLIPLFLFFFPALILVFIGPLLLSLIQEVKF